MAEVEADVATSHSRKRTFKNFSYRGLNPNFFLTCLPMILLSCPCSSSQNIPAVFEEEAYGFHQEAPQGVT
uniref:Uncharacterized protein n=1 Tax=Solanum lycopersicum TaxID=4081 RepID=A0A3Q7EEI5_SOLLC